MNSYDRARAYVLQGPSVRFTPRQARRFKRKLTPEQDAIIAARVTTCGTPNLVEDADEWCGREAGHEGEHRP
jgi:hypothetical protein